MKIFVLRHGKAEPYASADHLRELTVRGQSDVHTTILKKQASLASLQRAYVSPYVRAQQTFTHAKTLLPDIEQIDTDLLVPGANVDQLIAMLYQAHHEEAINSVLLVSHQPLVSTLLQTLCHLDYSAVWMSTSALALVELQVPASGCGELSWLINR